MDEHSCRSYRVSVFNVKRPGLSPSMLFFNYKCWLNMAIISAMLLHTHPLLPSFILLKSRGKEEMAMLDKMFGVSVWAWPKGSSTKQLCVSASE